MARYRDEIIATMKTCSIAGCSSRHFGKSFCNKHWKRWHKYGDPNKTINRKAGEGSPHNKGYWTRVINGRPVLRHVEISETVLGHPLPKGAEVHHVDGDRGNDKNTNLVICPDRAYHRMLHRRQRAFEATGHADWRKCRYCKKWDAPINVIIDARNAVHHRICVNEFHRSNRLRLLQS